MKDKKKILIVDDSFLVRKFLSQIFLSMPFIDHVETAADGQEALGAAVRLQPDLITLDVEMPVMNGLDVLKRLMMVQPSRVIMISSILPSDKEKAIAALRLGAIDIITKPQGASYRDNQDVIRKQLISKLQDVLSIPIDSIRYRRLWIQQEHFELPALAKNFSKENYNKLWPSSQNYLPTSFPKPQSHSRKSSSPHEQRVVVIGSSTGGTRALEGLLCNLPKNFQWPIIVAQHLPDNFTDALSKSLALHCRLSVVVARHGAHIVGGKVYVCPSGYDTKIVSIKDRFYFTQETMKSSAGTYTPSIDELFNSAVECYGNGTVGIILSGMGHDGMKGLLNIKEAGGLTFAQDEASCTVFGMPKHAIDAGAVGQVADVRAISGFLLIAANRGNRV